VKDKLFIIIVTITLLTIKIIMDNKPITKEEFPKLVYNLAKKEIVRFPEESIVRKIDPALVASIAILESGYGQFKGAPTAMAAKNYFGRRAVFDDDYIKTPRGTKLKEYNTLEENIKDFLVMMEKGNYYEDYRMSLEKNEPIQNQFKAIAKRYAENPQYSLALNSIYNTVMKPIKQMDRLSGTYISTGLDEQTKSLMQTASP
jgi:uncharacterized FlgJ-related protein